MIQIRAQLFAHFSSGVPSSLLSAPLPGPSRCTATAIPSGFICERKILKTNFSNPAYSAPYRSGIQPTASTHPDSSQIASIASATGNRTGKVPVAGLLAGGAQKCHADSHLSSFCRGADRAVHEVIKYPFYVYHLLKPECFLNMYILSNYVFNCHKYSISANIT